MEASRPYAGNAKEHAMNKSFVALAVAVVVGTGTAAAGDSTFRADERARGPFVPVQAIQLPAELDEFLGLVVQGPDQERRLSVDERQARIAQRIKEGVNRGDLTRSEARRLDRQLAATEHKERRFEADGRLGRRERTELHGDLDQGAQRLRFERRDDDWRRS